MKRIAPIILLFVLHILLAAQDADFKSLMSQGIALHDKGDYAGALERYAKALAIDPESATAYYETAYTYYAMKNYEKSVEYCDKVIARGKEQLEATFSLKGSALDDAGKPDEAVATFRIGISAFPQSNLLNYNLGQTLYVTRRYSEAESVLQTAILAKPGHASSHYLLGYVLSAEGKTVEALLAEYYFLLLEPKTDRSKRALTKIDELFQSGIKTGTDQGQTIVLSADELADDMRAASLLVSILQVSPSLDGKTPTEAFTFKTDSLFTVLGEQKSSDTGFYRSFYVSYFHQLSLDGHSEAFVNYILQSGDDPEAGNWLKAHQDKFDAFAKWHAAWRKNHP